MTKTESQYANYSTKAWGTRLDKMGDDAEAAFERNSGEKWIRYGLCRPPFSVGKLPLMTRYTPDYIDDGLAFVEVQGCSPRAGIKLKCEKMVVLQTSWAPLLPVDMFFWDSSRDKYMRIPLNDLMRMTKSDQVTIGTFKDPGGEKPYWHLKTSMFTWTADGEKTGNS
jgi:hypothetical protein